MADKTQPEVPDNVFVVIESNLVPIDKAVFKIGRHVSNDLIISDSNVSRYHAQINYKEAGFFIEDLGSTYGTRVNNEEITGEQGISNGDTISLAYTPVLFIDKSSVIVQRGDAETGTLEDLEK